MFSESTCASPHLFQPLQPLLRCIFSLLLRPSFPFSISRLFSFLPRYSSILFCRRVQGARKVANVGRISRVGCQTPLGDFLFPRARAWRAASRFVLSYCRVLSRRCVLTTAARPMQDPSGSGSLGYPAVPFVSPALASPHPPPRSLFRLFVQRDAFIRARCRRARIRARRARFAQTQNHAGI